MDRNELKLQAVWNELFQVKNANLDLQIQVQELTQEVEGYRAREEAKDVPEEIEDPNVTD